MRAAPADLPQKHSHLQILSSMLPQTPYVIFLLARITDDHSSRSKPLSVGKISLSAMHAIERMNHFRRYLLQSSQGLSWLRCAAQGRFSGRHQIWLLLASDDHHHRHHDARPDQIFCFKTTRMYILKLVFCVPCLVRNVYQLINCRSAS